MVFLGNSVVSVTMFAKTTHDTEKEKAPYARDHFQESTRGNVKVPVTNFKGLITRGTGAL